MLFFRFLQQNRGKWTPWGRMKQRQRQMEQHDMGHGKVAYIPIKTQIVFLDVPRDVAFTEKGDCDYSHIAVLLQNKGYPRSLWTIRSIWECQDDTGIF